MEPKISPLNLGPEQSGVNYGQNLEQPGRENSTAQQFEIGKNNLEQRGETFGGIAAQNSVLPMPVVTPLPEPVVQSNDGVGGLTGVDAPTLAGDEDLIEKEWVDKAKKIIMQTKDDPYRREQEVSKLQSEYLQKRYGREAGAA